MPEPDHLDSVDADQLAAGPDVTAESAGLIRLDWERFLGHSWLEPIRKSSADQRRYERLVLPNVVGYLGRAHASMPHQIANISVGGFCLLSDELWTLGTEMPITLHREEWDGDESSERVTVQAVVARREPRETGLSEVGFSIVLGAEESIAFLQSSYGAECVLGRKTHGAVPRRPEKAKNRRAYRRTLLPAKHLYLWPSATARLLELAGYHCVSVDPEVL